MGTNSMNELSASIEARKVLETEHPGCFVSFFYVKSIVNLVFIKYNLTLDFSMKYASFYNREGDPVGRLYSRKWGKIPVCP